MVGAWNAGEKDAGSIGCQYQGPAQLPHYGKKYYILRKDDQALLLLYTRKSYFSLVTEYRAVTPSEQDLTAKSYLCPKA